MDVTSGSVLLLSLFILLFHFLDAQGVPIEQECRRNNLPTYQCKKWNECSSSKEILHTGRAIFCGLENSVSKICCPPTNTSIKMMEKVTTPSATSTLEKKGVTTPISRENAIAVAERKCQEYSNYRYVNITMPSLIEGEPDIIYRKLDCANGQTLIPERTLARSKEFPHMALIGYGKNISSIEWKCSGSLISELFVLSAAHCGSLPTGEAKWVLLSDLNVALQIYRIVARFDHPNFNIRNPYNDITLFKLNTTVKFNPFVRPICLYTLLSVENTPNREVIATGWSRTGAAEPRSENLLKHRINVIDDNQCQKAYGNISHIFPRGYDSNSMICAGETGRPGSGLSTCWGDFGGTLQIPLADSFCMWSLVGVLSIGPSLCGDGETPSICTKVANYIDWIQPIVWPN